MLLPAAAGSGKSLFVRDRSAAEIPDCTVVVSVSLLLAALGSDDPLDTVAVLVRMVPLAVPLLTFTTNMNVAVAPAEKPPMVAAIVPVPPTGGVVKVKAGPKFCSNETKVVPAGMGSRRVTESPSVGPALVTVIV